MGFNPGGARLQGLGAPDLAAIDGPRGVVRHVLRLERTHGEAAPREGARSDVVAPDTSANWEGEGGNADGRRKKQRQRSQKSNVGCMTWV